MPKTVALLCTLYLLIGSDEADPRIGLVEDQLAGRTNEALKRARKLTAADPEGARALWLGYLQADLLERLGRLTDANAAFARLLGEDPELAARSRLRMASLQEAMGHPEVAAGLVATLLGRGAPADLAGPATDLLVRTLDNGADCRLLGRLEAWRISELERRALHLALAECELRGEDPDSATTRLIDLLEQETADLVGRRAAVLLSKLDTPRVGHPRTQIAIGLAFHHNREFVSAIEHLERGLAPLDPERLTLSPDALAEYRYAIARAYFWLHDYATAATLFGELATSADRAETSARAYYQKARCHELSGEWRQAAAAFRKSFVAQPAGEWSAAAVFSVLRIEFRSGREEAALELFEVLDSRPGWRDVARRAALFLSASDLERGRTDRATQWLRRAPGNEAIEEFLYWSARLAELDASPYLAIRNYIEILERNPHHPLAQEAAERLHQDPLAGLLEPVGQQLAGSSRRADLHAAWLLLGPETAGRQAVREALLASLRSDRRARVFLDLELVPPSHWPLWTARLERPSERLLALGLWAEGDAALGRHFPLSQPSLAFSAGALLGRAGLTRRSLYITEILADRVPSWVPEEMLPRPFREQLYPYPYRASIERHAAERGIDAHLLAGLIREESRWDPDAASVASARGLTQFVYPTALEVAASIGRQLTDASMLYEPETAIALGAAYLAQLSERFEGRIDAAVTAYNAGENQARLWRSYCYSRNPAEFYSKVGFAQTRSYLRRVLSSRSRYAELYGDRPGTLAAAR